MKKNLVSIAVAAAVVGTASVQAAQYINPEKTGQAILVPFYNADNGNATNVHLVNTTENVKAVKIRFVEYKNSDEVLDFNLYLSKHDHFAFGVIKDPNGDGAAIITSDNSCTVPALGSANGAFPGSATENADGSVTRIQPFVNYQYSGDADNTIGRTMTGHIEILEMGNITLAAAKTAATHGATGVPANCAYLDTRWANNAWATADTSAPTGGLYGLAYHINVEDAAAFGFEPTAIDGWRIAQAHTDPGNLLPSLASGVESAILHHNLGGDHHIATAWPTGIQATSAMMTTASISNDVMVNPALGGETDWVVTFPTKRNHVDTGITGIPPVVAPFTNTTAGSWIGKTTAGTESPACEVLTIEQWDREEAFTATTTGFSPSPAAVTTQICNEVAVVAMADTSALSVSTGLTKLAFPYSEGWQRFSFAQTSTASQPAVTLTGLPILGFAAYKVNNGAMSYGNAAEHKTDNVLSGVTADD
jgi:hypothetical protein